MLTSFQRYMVQWLTLRGGHGYVAGMRVSYREIVRNAALAEQCYWIVAE